MVTDLEATCSRIRAALIRRGRSAHDAEDLVQEAWLRLARYEQNHLVEVPAAFLMRTAINLSVDTYRASLGRGEEVPVEEQTLLHPAPTTEAVVLSRERVARLTVCLGRLSSKLRAIVLAHRLDGMTHQEIAEQHGISISAVEKHLARATQQLSNGMKDW